MTELPLKEDMTKSAIDYLEKQGYSIVEWVEFDSDDKTTWPKEGHSVSSNKGLVEFYIWAKEPNFENISFKNVTGVTRWAELPK